jgi:hypothetical protein
LCKPDQPDRIHPPNPITRTVRTDWLFGWLTDMISLNPTWSGRMKYYPQTRPARPEPTPTTGSPKIKSLVGSSSSTCFFSALCFVDSFSFYFSSHPSISFAFLLRFLHSFAFLLRFLHPTTLSRGLFFYQLPSYLLTFPCKCIRWFISCPLRKLRSSRVFKVLYHIEFSKSLHLFL